MRVSIRQIKRFWFCTLLLMACQSQNSHPQSQNSQPINMDSVRAAREMQLIPLLQANPEIEYTYDYKMGYPTLIKGVFRENQKSSDPVDAVFEFLESYKEIYGLDNPRVEMKVTRTSNSEIGAFVLLHQLYKGIPISGTEIRTHFNRSGKLYEIAASLLPDLEIVGTPSIDSVTAIGIARRDLNYTDEDERLALKELGDLAEHLLKRGRGPIRAWLYVMLYKDEYRFIWIVGLQRPNEPQFIWEYWIDAHSGIVLQKNKTASGISESIRKIDTSTAPKLKPKVLIGPPIKHPLDSTTKPTRKKR